MKNPYNLFNKNISLIENIITVGIMKNVGDLFQEINMILKNGGRENTMKNNTYEKEIIDNPKLLGISMDKPSAVRSMFLLLFGGENVRDNGVTGYVYKNIPKTIDVVNKPIDNSKILMKDYE